MKGILDRIEDNQLAIILMEEERKEIAIPYKELPKGSTINTYFDVTSKDGVYHLKINESETRKQSKRTSDLMQQLQKRKSNSKFKRK